LPGLILDTSALISVLVREEGWLLLAAKLQAARYIGIGAPSLLEAAMVLSRKLQRDARYELETFVLRYKVDVIPFRYEHFLAATETFLQFGKGRHAASLNFGDCQSYATALVAELPLLYTGSDFSKTDIRSA